MSHAQAERLRMKGAAHPSQRLVHPGARLRQSAKEQHRWSPTCSQRTTT